MNKHLKDHEDKMKSKYLKKIAKLTKYYDAMDRKCTFTGLDKKSLHEKLKKLKKQLMKDSREGKFIFNDKIM